MIGYEEGTTEILDVHTNKSLFKENFGAKIVDMDFLCDLHYGGLFFVTEHKEINGVKLLRQADGSFTREWEKQVLRTVEEATKEKNPLLNETYVSQGDMTLYVAYQKRENHLCLIDIYELVVEGKWAIVHLRLDIAKVFKLAGSKNDARCLQSILLEKDILIAHF
jgi:hypothetical protein